TGERSTGPFATPSSPLKSGHCEGRHRRCAQPLAQGKEESVRLDLKYIAILGLDPGAERQSGGTEEVDMDIAGPAEAGILEVMRFQIGDGVAHIVFPGQEGLVRDAFL